MLTGLSDKQRLRQIHQLPLDGVILANFNKIDKLDPISFQVWTQVYVWRVYVYIWCECVYSVYSVLYEALYLYLYLYLYICPIYQSLSTNFSLSIDVEAYSELLSVAYGTYQQENSRD